MGSLRRDDHAERGLRDPSGDVARAVRRLWRDVPRSHGARRPGQRRRLRPGGAAPPRAGRRICNGNGRSRPRHHRRRSGRSAYDRRRRQVLDFRAPDADDALQRDRHPGDVRLLRLQPSGLAARLPARRQAVRRGDGAAGGARLREGHALAVGSPATGFVDRLMTVTPATEYVDRARKLGPELEAAAAEIERRRELPEPIVEALIDRGLFGLLLPHALGGAELPPAAYVQVIEEVAQHDASTAWCLGQATGCTMTAALLEPEVAREIFGRKRGAVAWGPPRPAEARSVPGGYRLSGTWSFASGSHHATWLGAHVAILAKDGTPRLRPDGGPVIRTLLFPKASAKFTDIWHVIGFKGTGSERYT